MKKYIPVFVTLFALAANAQEDLYKFKGRNRILVFSAQSLSNTSFKKQWDAFLENTKKIEDRDLLLFVLIKQRIYDKDLKPVSHFNVNALRKKYNLPTSYEGFVLIGKDGGVKLKKDFFTEPKLIFQNIDQMPMRQREMRENIDD